jgi:hypothetical protein
MARVPELSDLDIERTTLAMPFEKFEHKGFFRRLKDLAYVRFAESLRRKLSEKTWPALNGWPKSSWPSITSGSLSGLETARVAGNGVPRTAAATSASPQFGGFGCHFQCERRSRATKKSTWGKLPT